MISRLRHCFHSRSGGVKAPETILPCTISDARNSVYPFLDPFAPITTFISTVPPREAELEECSHTESTTRQAGPYPGSPATNRQEGFEFRQQSKHGLRPRPDIIIAFVCLTPIMRPVPLPPCIPPQWVAVDSSPLSHEKWHNLRWWVVEVNVWT